MTAQPLPLGDFTLVELCFDYLPNPAKYPPVSATDFRMHTATLHHLQSCFLYYLALDGV